MNGSVLGLFDWEMRQELVIPDMRKDLLPWGVRFVRPAPGMSFILYQQLEESEVDEAIETQMVYFQKINQSFTWIIYAHDKSEYLIKRLAAHGFEPDEPAAVMLLELNQAPASLLAPVQADVRSITRREGLDEVIQVLEAVWGGSYAWVTQRLGSHLEIPGYLNVYAAYVNNRPASVSWIYFPPGSQFASLWAGSTLPEHRNQGLYTALLARRVQEAIQSGRRFVFIETGPESQPIVAKRGFEQLTIEQDFEWKPSD